MAGKEIRHRDTPSVAPPAITPQRAPQPASMEAVRSEVVEGGEQPTPSYSDEAMRADPSAEVRLRLDEATAELAGLSPGDPGYAEAVRARSSAYVGVLSQLSPEDQATFMEMGGAGMAADIMKIASSGGRELGQEVVGDLVRAGEALGQGNVALLGTALSDAPVEVMAPALRLAIQNGQGALLAVVLADQARGDAELGGMILGLQVDSALAATTGNFRGSSAEVSQLRQEIGAASLRMRSAGISEAEIKAFEDQARADNAAAFAEYERDAAIYASTLDGLSLDSRGEEPRLSEDRLDLVDSLALSEAGGQAAAEAMLKAGRGEVTWLDGLRERGDLNQSLIEHLYTQGAMQGVGALAATGDATEMAVLLRGVEQFAPEGTGAAIASIRDRVEGLSAKGLDRTELISELAGVFGPEADLSSEERALVETLGIGANLGAAAGLAGGVTGVASEVGQSRVLGRMSGAFGVLGNGLGVLSAEDNLSRAISGAGVATDVAGLAGRLSSRASVGIGTVFSVIQAGTEIAAGNNEAAAVAILPAIGATIGGVIGVFAGGVGAVPGAAIGSGVGTVLSAVLEMNGVGAVDGGAALAVPAITAALKARGVGSGAAAELADWFGSDDDSGRKFGFAAQRLGMEVDDLVLRLSKVPPEYREQFLYQVQRSIELGKDGASQGDAEGYLAFEQTLAQAPAGREEGPPSSDFRQALPFIGLGSPESSTADIKAYLASLKS